MHACQARWVCNMFEWNFRRWLTEEVGLNSIFEARAVEERERFMPAKAMPIPMV